MAERLAQSELSFVIGQKRNGRRIYSKAGKRALVEACLQPGVSTAKLALTHGLNANLLRKWITAYQSDLTLKAASPTAPHAPALLPVVVDVAPVDSTAVESPIEIMVGDATIRLHGAIDPEKLRTVLDCLAQRS